MTKFADQGGYHDMERKLYSTFGARHSMKPSQASLDALHVIQETAWVINEPVMRFVDWLQGEGAKSPMGLSRSAVPSVRVSALEYASLTKQQRRALAAERAEARSSNSKRSAVANRIDIANSLRDKGEFYQPQFMDFRGRLYPMNTEFNNQADHWAKGMMMFAEGTKLGESGFNHLAIHVANTWGQDKLQLDDRIKYVMDNIEDILSVADSYEDASRICSEADEPLAFYAAACDLAAAYRAENASEYVSHIPCAIDGTCNGLQILSLLGHDPVGAEKTNCTSHPQRQDIYMEVADIALDLVAKDLDSKEVVKTLGADGEECEVSVARIAEVWLAHLQDMNKRRKAVKRAIMTTAYGVSEFTIGNNLLEDGIVDKLVIPQDLDYAAAGKLKRVFSSYFRDVIVKAREGAIQSGVRIMDYFTATAAALGRENKPMTWTTPDGLQVTQSYRKTLKARYTSVTLGQLVTKKLTNNLDANKCGSGAAPQVVHSLDAAMLRMTAVRMADQGVTSLSMIHDSYGASAGSIDLLHATLREVAVEIFEGDWLMDSFHPEQAAHGIDLDLPPAQGDLDVASEIPEAVYFFS